MDTETKGTTMAAATRGAEKVRENRLRRMAERQGLALHKSRRRDPRAIDFGCWMIVDLFTNDVVTGTEGTGRPNIDLVQVEAYLTGGGSEGKAEGLHEDYRSLEGGGE